MCKFSLIYFLFLLLFFSCNQSLSNESEKSFTNTTSVFPKTTIKENAKDSNWQIINDKSGFSIELPKSFHEDSLTKPNIQYYTNTSDPAVKLFVETYSPPVLNSLTKEYDLHFNDEGIMYRFLKDSSFAFYGERGNTIFNYSEIFKNGKMHTLTLTYPKKMKSYDSIAWKITVSFK